MQLKDKKKGDKKMEDKKIEISQKWQKRPNNFFKSVDVIMTPYLFFHNKGVVVRCTAVEESV